jgi:hypothetical protein
MSSHVSSRVGSTALTFIFASLVATPVGAANEAGGVPGDWLARFQSARSAGLGGAMVALGEDPLNAFWNPASLSYTDRNEVRAETARLFEGTSVNAASVVIPGSGLPSFGVSVLSLSSGEIQRTSELNEPLGTFTESEMAFLLSASKPVTSSLTLGLNVKLVRQSLEEYGDFGYGADLGLLYDVSPRIRVGASILNLGGPRLTLRDTEESYPAEFREGVMVRGLSGKAVLTAEIDHRRGTGTELRTGNEYWLHPSMALRVGYDAAEPTGGMSLRPSENMQLDYGISDHQLGAVHRIGVSYRFGGFYAHTAASPEVFSPLGDRPVTRLHLKTRTKAETSEWNLVVVDKFDTVVRSYSGRGTPPPHVIWDGKDGHGTPLSDGTYRYTLSVLDAEGRKLDASPGAVEISTSGPRSGGTEITIG